MPDRFGGARRSPSSGRANAPKRVERALEVLVLESG
jgi:hypothetical protein